MAELTITKDGGGTHIGKAGQKVGFGGVATPLALPVEVTGIHASNTALQSLLAKLVLLGLITDSTTAS